MSVMMLRIFLSCSFVLADGKNGTATRTNKNDSSQNDDDDGDKIVSYTCFDTCYQSSGWFLCSVRETVARLLFFMRQYENNFKTILFFRANENKQ